jgi:hypothetical protein
VRINIKTTYVEGILLKASNTLSDETHAFDRRELFKGLWTGTKALGLLKATSFGLNLATPKDAEATTIGAPGFDFNMLLYFLIMEEFKPKEKYVHFIYNKEFNPLASPAVDKLVKAGRDYNVIYDRVFDPRANPAVEWLVRVSNGFDVKYNKEFNPLAIPGIKKIIFSNTDKL